MLEIEIQKNERMVNEEHLNNTIAQNLHQITYLNSMLFYKKKMGI